jgi:acyl dehydratase
MAVTGRVNESTLEAVRRRIGIPIRRRQRFHNEVASSDSFRHYAYGYGDDNPLYCDPEVAQNSCWDGVIAPPTYPFSAGRMPAVHWTESEAAAMSGGDPLAGIGQYMCGERWVFLQPVRPGDGLVRQQALFDAQLKPSRLGGGVGALVSHRVAWESVEGSPVCFRFLDFWHADRDKSAKAGKNLDIEPARYTDDDLAEIEACYEGEPRRGTTPRTVASVVAGSTLGPLAKGPLTLTDMISHHVGVGFGVYGGGSTTLAYKTRQRIPKFYDKNSFGAWDSVQRCHWDGDYARSLGQPAAYDYGLMRTNWFVHLVTNWMGDPAWLWKLSVSIDSFGYLGDTHLVSGEVTSVDEITGQVVITLRGVNQRGVTTCTGEAVVVLPSSDTDLVLLPTYDPADVPAAQAP